MVHPSDGSPHVGSVASPVRAPSRLDGARMSLTALLLLACGTFGGVIFAGVYVIEGATRPGYDARQYAISVLSLGPGGWMQQVNFIVFGVLVIGSAFGWRLALRSGAGATWYPILKGIMGVGLVVDGFFSQDPVVGYPMGTTAVGASTTHGVIHNLAAFVTITAIAISCFLLARRFALEPRWRGWGLYAVVTGLLTMALIAVFGSMNGHAGAPAGLFERLATGINTVLSLLVFARLLLDRRRYARQ